MILNLHQLLQTLQWKELNRQQMLREQALIQQLLPLLLQTVQRKRGFMQLQQTWKGLQKPQNVQRQPLILEELLVLLQMVVAVPELQAVRAVLLLLQLRLVPLLLQLRLRLRLRLQMVVPFPEIHLIMLLLAWVAVMKVAVMKVAEDGVMLKFLKFT